eukprot:m.143874 g.143874  ORF g.143874 m.143874 type:complete len:58 (-) comp14105_c1_seq2:4175-4348(-)
MSVEQGKHGIHQHYASPFALHASPELAGGVSAPANSNRADDVECLACLRGGFGGGSP